MTVTDYWSGEGEAPLPRPDQYESRDATEERLTRELMPVAETFAVLLSERLVHDIGQLYTDPSSLSAAGPLKPPPPPKGFNPANPKPPPPKGFNPADPNWQRLGETLWQEAARPYSPRTGGDVCGL